jgi:hypothetical protein
MARDAPARIPRSVGCWCVGLAIENMFFLVCSCRHCAGRARFFQNALALSTPINEFITGLVDKRLLKLRSTGLS